ncbi:nuclear transport factor 2 family protein [Paenarthrobacter sp. NPDC057981]|uniref:nuclear transport factor 2 family protein n=1 Tax=Paenarthrobacter sp. NPDC057981 TaxID=3346297 RepID=UPI0036DB5DFD
MELRSSHAPPGDTTPHTEIEALEHERFDAIVEGDLEKFASLCHERLVYTHSDGSRDTLDSYLGKVRRGVYNYSRISHPVDQIIVIGDVALVVGRMTADLTINGTPKRLDNTSLAVWVREADQWKFLAYQPTPAPTVIPQQSS